MNPLPRPPNILFILSDQHRRNDLGCYGNSEVISPHFDQMAREGIRFDHAVSTAPVCAPYRSILQTGLLPHANGVVTNGSPYLANHLPSLADIFHQAGYETCFIGKAHWGKRDWEGPAGYTPPEKRLGWKTWYGMGGHNHYSSKLFDDEGNIDIDYSGYYQPELQTDLAIHHMCRHRRHPWFIQLNWSAPHDVDIPNLYQDPATFQKMRDLNHELDLGLDDAGLQPGVSPYPMLDIAQHLLAKITPQRYLDLYHLDNHTVEANVEGKWLKAIRYFYQEIRAAITSMDDQLGRIMEFLKTSGIDENTLVIYTSDHGDELGTLQERMRGKSRPTQNSIRVPFLVWGPKVGVPQDQVSDTLISSIDLLPTLAGFAGVPHHLPPHGVDLSHVFRNTQSEGQGDVLLSLNNWRGLFDGRFLYAVAHPPAAATWHCLHLIDTVNDPLDQNDLQGNPAYDDIRHALHRRLAQRLMEVDDNFFDGTSPDLPRPAAAPRR